MMNFREKLARVMVGRYGIDELTRFLFILVCIVMAIGVVFNGRIFELLALALLILACLRMFSRNIDRHRRENISYLSFCQRLRHFFSSLKRQRQDRNHRYFSCPKCQTVLRVPRGRGKILITCTCCGHKFEKKS